MKVVRDVAGAAGIVTARPLCARARARGQVHARDGPMGSAKDDSRNERACRDRIRGRNDRWDPKQRRPRGERRL